MIAFFSESKSVVININKFGEQYIDLFALVIIWIICLVGLIILFWMIKEEKILEYSLYKSDKRPIIQQNQSFYDRDNSIGLKKDEIQITEFFIEPVKNIDKKINLKD